VGVDTARLEADTRLARQGRPHVLAQLNRGVGLDSVVRFLVAEGGLPVALDRAS
jgi:urease accessory protein